MPEVSLSQDTPPRQPTALVLASASPRRNDLLNEVGYRFEIVPSGVDEIDGQPGDDPGELTEANAFLKASDVAGSRPDAVVIGADTLVFYGGRAFGKPRDMDEARAMLGELCGQTHQVVTGVALCPGISGSDGSAFHIATEVTFKPLTSEEIDAYLGLIEPLDKAGAYAAQDHGDRIIERIEGSWTNVVGLPMERLSEELARYATSGE